MPRLCPLLLSLLIASSAPPPTETFAVNRKASFLALWSLRGANCEGAASRGALHGSGRHYQRQCP
jgi:hypothetical protein